MWLTHTPPTALLRNTSIHPLGEKKSVVKYRELLLLLTEFSAAGNLIAFDDGVGEAQTVDRGKERIVTGVVLLLVVPAV